ncbi:hypothetical protein BN3590_01383 [Clostridium sp. C105KSO15]|nr:hypothetical protein BN3590_01383 [Clostridium sp. C105KSO15]
MLDKFKYTDKELDELVKSMTILVDTREKNNQHLLDYWDSKGIPHKKKALSYGDYSFMLPQSENLNIPTTIESHMGIWNTDKKSPVVLPLPKNKYQKMVHLADYLASRKDIELVFEEYVAPEIPDINEYVLTFGKHSGEKLIDVAKSDPNYIVWAKENMNKEPVRSLLKKL